VALGVDPDVPEELARIRHRAARKLLAAGIDPAQRRNELRYLAAS
jgi:hypothetical protein